MSFQKENYEIYTICLSILGAAFAILFVHWGIENGILALPYPKIMKYFYIFYIKIDPYITHIRISYVFASLGVFYIKPPVAPSSASDKTTRAGIAFFIIAIFFFGYSPIAFYSLFVYPLLIFAVLFSAYLIVSLFGRTFKDQNIFGLSNEKVYKKLKYSFFTADKKILSVHSAEQHIYVQGGSGAGKSDTILKPTLYQHAFMDYPALIYDFKGDPMTLGKTAHTAYVHAKLEGIEHKTQLKYINFSDITRSNRVNPFSARYFEDNADIQQTIATLLKNFSREFREGKGDVWYKGAKAIWVSLIIRFQNDPALADKVSLPIINELLLCDDKEALIAFICEDEQAKKQLSSVQDSKANVKQFVGYITSANDFCSMLASKNLYWLLSEDEVNLNINTKEEPTFLCIASNERKKEVYNPIVAMIIDICSKYFLEQNKLPTLFQIDEIYTIYLENLPEQANVFRSNGVCLQIGNQMPAQLIDKYGQEKAKVVMGACGNQFIGQSSDAGSAELFQKLLSDVEMHSVSQSISDSGLSRSDSTKRQKAMEIRDLASQPTGMFTGKIANGNPAFFSAQFERFPFHDQEIEVPAFVLEKTPIKELNALVDQNFDNICKLAATIINNYKKTEINTL